MRAWIDYPYSNLWNPWPYDIEGDNSPVPVTAVASGQLYTVFGSGAKRLELETVCYPAMLGGGCELSVEYEPSPVKISGPWNGGAHSLREVQQPDNPLGTETFGDALALDGHWMAIGSSSVFTWDHTVSPELEITTTTSAAAGGRVHLYHVLSWAISRQRTIVHGGLEERFGASVDLKDGNLFVGRPGAVPGAADLFERDTGTLITSFTSGGSNDGFGEHVALAGDLALVAAPTGEAVYVYRSDGGGSFSAAGTLDSAGPGSAFGASLAADGDRIIVGAPGIDRAYIYEDDGDNNWPVVAQLSGGNSSEFGTDVALVGDVAFVSAPRLQFGPTRVGLVVRHERGDGSWPFVNATKSRQPRDGDGYGSLVSASPTMMAAAEIDSAGSPTEMSIHTGANTFFDSDNDGLVGFNDNCPDAANLGQDDLDGDGQGDACDPDIDNDGLSNTEEASIGSDPYNPDTDGDGSLDGNDYDPLVPDSDYDGLSDAEEVSLGTDPLDNDTDDDGRLDGSDSHPLDPKNGWSERLQRIDVKFDDASVALGDDVLIVGEDVTGEVKVWVRDARNWIAAPAPTINGAALPKIRRIAMHGSVAVLVEYGVNDHLAHAFEYDPVSGWILLGSINTQTQPGIPPSSISQVAVYDGTVALMVSGGERNILLFEKLAGSLQSLATINIPYGGWLGLAGNTAFVATPSSEGVIAVYEPGNGYQRQEIRLPEGQYGSNPQLGLQITASGPNELLAGSKVGGFWLRKSDGAWQLTALDIPAQQSTSPYWLAGGGSWQIVINGGNEWLLYSGQDNSSLGQLVVPANNNDGRTPMTNGRTIVHGVRDGSSGPHYLHIYDPELPLPPGC